MKKLAIASALALSLAMPAIAQETVQSDGIFYTQTDKSDFYASTLIGSRIYATTTEVDTSKAIDKVTEEWNDIGEINNIIVGRDGKVKAVILGVGGFLGIGEKDVAVQMDDLKFVKKAGDSNDDYFVVVNSDKAALEKAPAYKRTAG